MVVRVVPRSGNQENLCDSLLTVNRVCGVVSGSRIVFNPVNLSIYYLDLHYLSSPYQESSLPPRARLVRPLVYPARARLLYVPCLVFLSICLPSFSRYLGSQALILSLNLPQCESVSSVKSANPCLCPLHL